MAGRRRWGNPSGKQVAEEGELGGGCGEGASSEQPRTVVTTEEGGGGGTGEGESDEQPCAAVTADAKISTGASYEGGVGFGLRAIDGQPHTVAMAEERQGHVGADGGGSAGEQIDGVLDAWKAGCFLLHAVIKWGVEDVMNSNLYKAKAFIVSYPIDY